MRIAYFEPLARAWERMKHILWRPFDLAKWLVLGFSCWLAGLADGAGGGGWKWIADKNDFPGRHTIYSRSGSYEEIGEALIWLPLIFIIIMAVAAILLLILWLSSRAKMIYLDNVVHNRAQIVEPWNRLRTLGNSLFLWRVGFVVVCGSFILASQFSMPRVEEFVLKVCHFKHGHVERLCNLHLVDGPFIKVTSSQMAVGDHRVETGPDRRRQLVDSQVRWESTSTSRPTRILSVFGTRTAFRTTLG